MKIVVCVKLAARIAGYPAIDPDSGRLAAESMEWVSNEWDLHAAEEALRLTEDMRTSDVMAITVGDKAAEATLRWCLAMGADRAIRVTSRAEDPIAVARALAAGLAGETPDLILTGAQSGDGLHSTTGAGLAGLLGIPHIPLVTQIDGGDLPERLVATRELEGGSFEQLATRLPAVLTIQTGINDPRYLTLRARKRAAEKDLKVVAFEDSSPPASRVLGTLLPPEGSRADMLAGSNQEIAHQIAAIVGSKLG